MTSEFVRFTGAEQIYGEKALLQLQIGMIETIKRAKDFKNIRNDSHILKIVLKSKISELNELLESLKRLLPKPAIQDTEPLVLLSPLMDKQRISLEEEIEMIKRKLDKLNY
jgi:hypothetical protein